MNVPAIVSLLAATNGALIALLAWRVSKAPNWEHKRYFVLVAVCACVYAAADALSFVASEPAYFLTLMRVQGAVVMLHGACWLVYASAHLGIRRPWTLGIALGISGLLAAAWLVPGCMMDDHIRSVAVPWLGVTYDVQTTTTLGRATSALACALLLLLIGLYYHARRRVPGAGLHAAGLSLLLACGVYDALVGQVALPLPFVLPLGFLVSIGVIGVSLASAFVESARALDALTKDLERLVGERTGKLLAAETALARAEKLAAIGALSAGVAHEINNPAAAIMANLDYLRMSLAKGGAPADAADCIDDCSAGIERIAAIVRKLLDLARPAVSPKAGSVSVTGVIEQALAAVRPQLDPRVTIDVDAEPDIRTRGDAPSLVQVLVNLLANAAEAIPEEQSSALVHVKARERDGLVTLEVQDNGAGIPEDLRSRLFEPFLTTKPRGKGTGLGLSVSLGLVRSMGGEIEVDSRPGDTTMRVCLPAAAGDDRAPDVAAPTS